MIWNEVRASDPHIPANDRIDAAVAKRLVVATDLSPRSDLAARRALLLAARHRASVLLLHVADEARPRRILREETCRAQSLLEDWYGPAGRRNGFELEIRVEAGAAAETIGRFARAEGADLLLFGEPRGRLLTDVLGGATMERAMRASGLPALTVRLPPRRPYRDVVLGLDLTEGARQVAAGATTLGLLAAPGLRVVHAFTAYGSSRMLRVGIHPSEAEEHVADSAIAAEADLRRFLSRTGLSRLRPAIHVEEGDPFHAIAAAAEAASADLVVVGQRLSGGLGRLLRGSMASELLQRVRCDVLAVPSSPPDVPSSAGARPKTSGSARLPTSAGLAAGKLR
jgi:nucleotide-binding universal stress UspA family protein